MVLMTPLMVHKKSYWFNEVCKFVRAPARFIKNAEVKDLGPCGCLLKVVGCPLLYEKSDETLLSISRHLSLLWGPV